MKLYYKLYYMYPYQKYSPPLKKCYHGLMKSAMNGIYDKNEIINVLMSMCSNIYPNALSSPPVLTQICFT